MLKEPELQSSPQKYTHKAKCGCKSRQKLGAREVNFEAVHSSVLIWARSGWFQLHFVPSQVASGNPIWPAPSRTSLGAIIEASLTFSLMSGPALSNLLGFVNVQRIRWFRRGIETGFFTADSRRALGDGHSCRPMGKISVERGKMPSGQLTRRGNATLTAGGQRLVFALFPRPRPTETVSHYQSIR